MILDPILLPLTYPSLLPFSHPSMEAAIRSSFLAIPYPASLPRGSPARLSAAGDRAFFLHLRQRPPLSLRASSSSSGTGRLDAPGEPVPVDVIGIGSRKDAVIGFCLDSSLASPSCCFKFWTIHSRDSLKVQLLEKHHGTDVVLRNVGFPLSLHPSPPAVILIASAGHGFDHITAAELLHAVKSTGGLAAAIILKPFSFEGQRRQEEVDDMIEKLQECSHFYIVVEADSLLKTGVETLAEALESANNAVFLAINAISTLMSDIHLKFLCTPEEEIKEVEQLEVVKLLESYREAKVGFGAGYNIRAAIIQAVFHCPFLSGGIKDIKGLVIITLSSACTFDESDFLSIILTFRRITGYTREIIFSKIHEPDLEPNLVVTTLLIVGCNAKMVSTKKSLLSRLALQFPLIFSLLGRESPEPSDNLSVQQPSESPADIFSSGSSSSRSIPGLDLVNAAAKSDSVYSGEIEQSGNWGNICRIQSLEVKSESVSGSDDQIYEVQLTEPDLVNYPEIQREESCSWGLDPGFYIAQLWAKERASMTGTAKIDKQEFFTLPIGVKSTELYSDQSPNLNHTPEETSDHISGDSMGTPNLTSTLASSDSGLEGIFGIYNSALAFLKRRNIDESRNPGLLSVRAATMLEAERESQKSWAPIVEMQYRGGTYRGRCQGGLPEGKGRLTYVDGSFYDGMWRYGKRFGLGTFCYCNGDVFQGTWRDDLMHGKGWFYFHMGDRWFANFWKGKANGEGRFYSKNGSIFFGQFQNGWRHGQSLFIDVDGSRRAEIWNEGVLLSRTQLDRETCG